ncbi:thiosulfate sulfurtransferase GlpE [Psychrosphaera ytuae]|uniref:Thiosulfate sulfurtransferase GlpE n=1 Tax=Psychrosphaera ytuae TaxID=2820710 RepID=A0A975DA40_9GAMM|nr:thiosulfate sulfurtransferase GlpE [Psychrosphaera ytuae]QTH62994.1 thiosulfate sulfurtransferase GlpE [Psychrosphaera ytuae]
MSTFKRISIVDAKQLIDEGNAAVADIRDEQSFAGGHVEGAFHLTNGTLNQFCQQVDYEQTVLVFCYHGHSSQGAAQYLVEQGFDDVYSVDGGFEMWRQNFPFVQSAE